MLKDCNRLPTEVLVLCACQCLRSIWIMPSITSGEVVRLDDRHPKKTPSRGLIISPGARGLGGRQGLGKFWFMPRAKGMGGSRVVEKSAPINVLGLRRVDLTAWATGVSSPCGDTDNKKKMEK